VSLLDLPIALPSIEWSGTVGQFAKVEAHEPSRHLSPESRNGPSPRGSSARVSSAAHR
jgi:hypothetical protein